MIISGIDEGFVDIINYLAEKGFKTYGSCDGIESHHMDDMHISSAYIAFMKSTQIIDLLAAFLRDRDTFSVMFSNESSTLPQEMYGNLIEGNTYSVSFQNTTGAMTSYFERIIKSVVEGQVNIEDDETEYLRKLDSVLEDDGKTDLNIMVILNSEYQPYMEKSRKTNVLSITTKDGILNGMGTPPKEGYVYRRSMNALLDKLSQKYGIIKKSVSADEVFEEDEFSTTLDDVSCEIYFKDEHMWQILEQIKYIKEIGDSLPVLEVIDVDALDCEDIYSDEMMEEEIDVYDDIDPDI